MTTTEERPSRGWTRAAVWGGALASTALNLSANWHARTVDGLTVFVSPMQGGLQLPEAAKLVVSGLFPLLLLFAVESAAGAGIRLRVRDVGSWAMPLAALAVFAFSVGEVSRLMLGMGQPVPLAILFALAPDFLITAGTVVLLRQRKAVVSGRTSGRVRDADPDVRVVLPDVRDVRQDVTEAAQPTPDVPAAREDTVPDVPDTAEAAPDVRGEQQDAHPDVPDPTPVAVIIPENDVVQWITHYREREGALPKAAAVKKALGISWDRANRIISRMSTTSEEQTG